MAVLRGLSLGWVGFWVRFGVLFNVLSGPCQAAGGALDWALMCQLASASLLAGTCEPALAGTFLRNDSPVSVNR